MFPNRNLALLVLLVALVSSTQGVSSPPKENGWLLNRVDVRIINDLGNGLALGVHCKSKQDDLGEHVMAAGQFFEFSFRPNIWGTTLFFCRFWWTGATPWFNIYKSSRDVNMCDSHCWWMIRESGPCLLNRDTGKYDLCEKWTYGVDMEYLEQSREEKEKDFHH